jgi:hypothetical protein
MPADSFVRRPQSFFTSARGNQHALGVRSSPITASFFPLVADLQRHGIVPLSAFELEQFRGVAAADLL